MYCTSTEKNHCAFIIVVVTVNNNNNNNNDNIDCAGILIITTRPYLSATMSLCDFQLVQNEVNTEAIADEWRPIIKECTSVCLGGDLHKDCNICYILAIQTKHCASCHVDICAVCSRVVALISMHYAECRQLRQQSCRCVEYLPASRNPALDSFSGVGMVSRDRVRAYLQSLFPTSDHANVEDNNSDNDDDDDDGSDDENDKDPDSDSSEDSIMMPSFSSNIPSVLMPSNKASGAPGFNEPEGNAHRIAHNLPPLSGRGIDSATGLTHATSGLTHTTQLMKPLSQAVGGAAGAAISDPCNCMSFQAQASSASLHGGVIHSVPVTGGLRRRSRICYGTKIELCQFAKKVHSERARREALCHLDDLHGDGVILKDFEHVSCFQQ